MKFSAFGKRRTQAKFWAMMALAVIAVVFSTTKTRLAVHAFSTVTTSSQKKTSPTTSLCMAPPGSNSLKPASGPMMDSGKALARTGELLIDLTRALDLYGGALSAAGAQIRNSGDSLAQAAASCRFKTGTEIVIDELREAATCLSEATDKLNQAVEEAQADQDPQLESLVQALVQPTRFCATKLEESGRRIMMRNTLQEIGGCLVEASQGMEVMAGGIQKLSEESDQNADGLLAAQRLTFASERLNQAGIELKGDVEKKKPQGREFLKGGF